MPDRYVKKSICASESLSELSWFEQVLFIRLILSVDDYGRYDARPAIIKGSVFPLEDVTVKQIQSALTKLSTNGMICLYEVAGKPYLVLCAWRKYNIPRAKQSKFPAPPDNAESCMHMFTDENITKQINADAPDIRYSVFDVRNSKNDIRYPISVIPDVQDNGEKGGYAAADDSIFDSFWENYPTNRGGRSAAYNAWKEINPDAAAAKQILDALDSFKSCAEWRKSDGQYIPGAAKFLRERRYLKPPVLTADPVPKGASGHLGQAEMDAIKRLMEG